MATIGEWERFFRKAQPLERLDWNEAFNVLPPFIFHQFKGLRAVHKILCTVMVEEKLKRKKGD